MNNTSAEIYYLIEKKFDIKSNIQQCDIIEMNKKIYTDILFPMNNLFNTSFESNSIKYLTELNIEVTSQTECPTYPDTTMDESCKSV